MDWITLQQHNVCIIWLYHYQHSSHYSLLSGEGWGSREVIICYLPDYTVCLGTSWVGLCVLAAAASSEIGSRYKESLFLSL